MKRLLAIALFIATPAFGEDCSDKYNYAAMFKMEQLLRISASESDIRDLSSKERGNKHWLLRTRVSPWARRLPDGCFRIEMLDWVSTISSYLDDAESQPQDPQAEGRALADSVPNPEPAQPVQMRKK